MKETLDEHKDVHIPYRMKAVHTLNVALELTQNNTTKPMKIYFGDDLMIEGAPSGWTNPAIEAGIVHGRALLQFLGLTLDPKGTDKLKVNDKRHDRNDDITINKFRKSDGCPLHRITVHDAVSKYAGPADEAERALARLIRIANKWIAHPTSDLCLDDKNYNLLETASRGIPSLVISYFYTPLNLPEPDYKIVSRHHH